MLKLNLWGEQTEGPTTEPWSIPIFCRQKSLQKVLRKGQREMGNKETLPPPKPHGRHLQKTRVKQGEDFKLTIKLMTYFYFCSEMYGAKVVSPTHN